MKSYKCIRIGGKQIRLHRYLMEQSLGRKLKTTELVHHIDGNKHNNILSNLELTTRGGHMKTHAPGKKYRFKTKYSIRVEDLIELYVKQKLPMWKIGEVTNTNYGVVYRAIKKQGIKRNIKCGVCGTGAAYLNVELCKKCYLKAYYHANK